MTPGSGWQCHPDLVRGEPCRYDGAMRDIDQAKRVRLLLAIFLPACLLVLGGFYALMFQRDNAAPVVDFADYRTRGTVGFQYRMEECWSNRSEERRVGKECVGTRRFGWAPDN